MAMKAAVRQSADGLHIEVTGGAAGQLDPAVLQGIANWLVACSRSTKCLQNGLNLNADGVHSLAEFVLSSACLTTGCGTISAAAGARPAPAAGGSSKCQATSTGRGLSLLCAEPEARHFDVAAVEKCANSVLACVEATGCVSEKGIVITEAAVKSLLHASRESNCLANGLGLRGKAY